MTSADLHGSAAASPKGRGLVSRVSGSVLAANFAIAFDATADGGPAVADLRADAWGHGGAVVTAVLCAVAPGLRVKRDAVLAPSGARIQVGTVDAEPNVDLLTLYGLPGGAPGSVPAMQLRGLVLSTKALRAGEGVSYGYAHRTPSDTSVALVTGGYAQGIVRSLGGRATVSIAGTRHPIVGRVAMDVCVVDVGAAQVARGDEVVFLGDPSRGEPTILEWAAATGMRAAELVTTVGQRAAREYVA